MAAIGTVSLRVADLAGVQSFYERTLGLRALEASAGGDDPGRRGGTEAEAGARAVLGVDGGSPLIELVGDPDAPAAPRGSTGLYHLAILFPSRRDLAGAVRHLLDAGARLTGASDHLVSEALYLHDPEGNGIELYRDRPRDEWRYAHGELQMATLPLDLDGLLAETPDPAPAAPAGTTIGHVHLRVAELAAAEAFYVDGLGLDATVRSYPGALFVSAGGYHHHIGLNTWESAGSPPPPPGSRGLRHFELVVPSGAELERIAARLATAGVPTRQVGNGLHASDPSGNGVLLRRARA